MMIMPPTVFNVGDSAGSIAQLSKAPKMGLISRHILISETFTPGCCKAINQKLKAKSDTKTKEARHP